MNDRQVVFEHIGSLMKLTLCSFLVRRFWNENSVESIRHYYMQLLKLVYSIDVSIITSDIS